MNENKVRKLKQSKLKTTVVYLTRDKGDSIVYLHMEKPVYNSKIDSYEYAGTKPMTYMPPRFRKMICPIEIYEGEMVQVVCNSMMTVTDSLGNIVDIKDRKI